MPPYWPEQAGAGNYHPISQTSIPCKIMENWLEMKSWPIWRLTTCFLMLSLVLNHCPCAHVLNTVLLGLHFTIGPPP